MCTLDPNLVYFCKISNEMSTYFSGGKTYSNVCLLSILVVQMCHLRQQVPWCHQKYAVGDDTASTKPCTNKGW